MGPDRSVRADSLRAGRSCPVLSESFFATYKKELIHRRPWPDMKSLRKETVDWIENYYNTIRRHSTLGYP